MCTSVTPRRRAAVRATSAVTRKSSAPSSSSARAQRRARHVEGHVAAADHDHARADLDRLAEVRELQELEAVDDAGQVRARDVGRRLPCRPAPMKNALKPSRRRSLERAARARPPAR